MSSPYFLNCSANLSNLFCILLFLTISFPILLDNSSCSILIFSLFLGLILLVFLDQFFPAFSVLLFVIFLFFDVPLQVLLLFLLPPLVVFFFLFPPRDAFLLNVLLLLLLLYVFFLGGLSLNSCCNLFASSSD